MWDSRPCSVHGGEAVNLQQGQGAYYEDMADLGPEGRESSDRNASKVGVA